MATVMVSSSSVAVLLVSSDPDFRRGLRKELTTLRWQVREACGGAEALSLLESEPIAAVVLDSWLPDLTIEDFTQELSTSFPHVDVVTGDGTAVNPASKNSRRGELLYALRRQDNVSGNSGESANAARTSAQPAPLNVRARTGVASGPATHSPTGIVLVSGAAAQKSGSLARLPEFIGSHPAMLEVSRRIRLVAPRKTSVLIQGPTGSGKELVARALHRLSPRADRAFVALNCAAIPESLLEAELFGHSRGAFTGAVQKRVGRIEAADGGTLFLDEIGEMPLALQSKLLRFLETGELQRVGENDSVHVDVRVIAATHQPLAARAKEGSFRADLFYRLAVFLVTTPALADHAADVPALAEHFLTRIGQSSPMKQFTPDGIRALEAHTWPGNVRELAHVIERVYILAEDRPQITADEIEFGAIA